MLHDPRWNHGTLDGLITWLEGMPRDGTYIFLDSENCLVTQYMGNQQRHAWPDEMKSIYTGGDRYGIARGVGDPGSPQTYGAALERAYLARAAVNA